jgi:hypothetical protein
VPASPIERFASAPAGAMETARDAGASIFGVVGAPGTLALQQGHRESLAARGGS